MVVLLAPAPFGAVRLKLLRRLAASGRQDPDGLHLRLPHGLQALVLGSPPEQGALGALLPLERDLAARFAAARRLESALHGARGASPPPRLRFARMLRAQDARDEGASYRAIAEEVLGASFASTADWATAPARDVAIRLCRAAAAMVRGGYRRLLRRRE